MHQAGRKRQNYSGQARQHRAHTLKVYLDSEERAALRRLAREMGISDSYAATLAIRQFRAIVEAEKIDGDINHPPSLRIKHN
ncbi:MAG: hypothetical protein OXH50_08170 [Gemmatimonadetes bacterium]|nr:hypothetical protein [Gemmatimonadota bacterium]